MKWSIVSVVVVSLIAQSTLTAQSLEGIRAGLSKTQGPLSIAIASIPIVLQPASCETARATGREDADTRHGSAGWFVGGVVSGVLVGLIGTGIITGASALTSPQPRLVPPELTGGIENCYRDGYKGKAKNKNVVSSLLGGLSGTAVWLAIYAANN
jgi:hypothetical protein